MGSVENNKRVHDFLLAGLLAEERQDHEEYWEHQQDQYEHVLSLSLSALELIFTVRAAKFFFHRDWCRTDSTVPVFRDGGFLLVASEILGHTNLT